MDRFSPNRVCVVGATGRTGRYIVETLVKQGIPTRAGVRDLDRARSLFAPLPPNLLEIVPLNVLQPSTLEFALRGCDRLICATGERPSLNPTGPFLVDYLGTTNLIKASQDLDIQHFVLITSLCVSQFFHFLNLFWLVLFWKKLSEGQLISSGLPYTIVRPGGLLEVPKADQSQLVVKGADRLWGGSIPRYRVAEVCVNALLIPEARNQVFEIICQSQPDLEGYANLFPALSSTTQS